MSRAVIAILCALGGLVMAAVLYAVYVITLVNFNVR